MPSVMDFRLLDGMLDVSPYGFAQPPGDQVEELLEQLDHAFSQAKGLIALHEPTHGLKYRVSRSMESISDRSYACIKGAVLHDRIGGFRDNGLDERGEAKLSLFMHFAKIINSDGFADIIMTDWDGNWKRPFQEIKSRLTGNETESWNLLLDNFGDMYKRGSPAARWIFSHKPGNEVGWATSR